MSVPVPRDVRPGSRSVVIEGNGFSPDEDEVVIEIAEDLSRGSGSGRPAPVARSARSEPRSVRELARRVAAMARPLGITATFRGREPRVVLRSDEVSFEGSAKLSVTVLKPAGRR